MQSSCCAWSFQDWCQKTKRGSESILQALYNLFPNSPAKRGNYTKIIGSKVFPLLFSGTRWIDDKKVADRALEIWPNITRIVSKTLKEPKSQVPTSGYLPHSDQLYRMIS